MEKEFIHGMAVGGSLIIAIGAQNAFVLSQGVRRQHHFLIPMICSICDLLLIMIGVAGVGSAVASNPTLKNLAAWGGALFLCWYGLNALKSGIKGNEKGLAVESNGSIQGNVIVITLALTFLNPHVYLDTIVLMGSISGHYEGSARYIFGLGAGLSSLIWFFTLSLFGTVLAPLFQKRSSWQVLDIIVAVTMFVIAWKLVAPFF